MNIEEAEETSPLKDWSREREEAQDRARDRGTLLRPPIEEPPEEEPETNPETEETTPPSNERPQIHIPHGFEVTTIHFNEEGQPYDVVVTRKRGVKLIVLLIAATGVTLVLAQVIVAYIFSLSSFPFS